MRRQNPMADGQTETNGADPESPLLDDIYTDQNHHYARVGRQMRGDAIVNHLRSARAILAELLRGGKRQST